VHALSAMSGQVASSSVGLTPDLVIDTVYLGSFTGDTNLGPLGLYSAIFAEDSRSHKLFEETILQFR
jgi:hypothetical protein